MELRELTVVMHAFDNAMNLEDVPWSTRERVISRILYDDPEYTQRQAVKQYEEAFTYMPPPRTFMDEIRKHFNANGDYIPPTR
jgi:hypothetical protein